mgnify:CR=1 FL=1
MSNIFMNDSAKAVVLNATLRAERNFIDSVRNHALLDNNGLLWQRANEAVRRCQVKYATLYRLCNDLNIADLYADWREDPEYDEEE